MKKTISLLLFTTALLTASIAHAQTTYYSDTNKVESTDTENYKTVIITKDSEQFTDDDIVYIDEADNLFEGICNFALKQGAPDGVYTITLSGNNGTIKTKKFAIGVGEESGDYALTHLVEYGEQKLGDKQNTNDNSWTMSFVTEEAIELSYFNSVLLKVNNNVLEIKPETNLTGEGSVMLGIELNDISSDDYGTDGSNIGIYLRPSSLGE